MEQNTLEITFITDRTEGELSFEQLKRSQLLNRVIQFDNNVEPSDYIFDEPNQTSPVATLLLFDIAGANWQELIDKLRSRNSTRKIFLLILISSEEERKFLERRELDIEDYLIKPVNFKEFQRTLLKLRFSWSILSRNLIGQN